MAATTSIRRRTTRLVAVSVLSLFVLINLFYVSRNGHTWRDMSTLNSKWRFPVEPMVVEPVCKRRQRAQDELESSKRNRALFAPVVNGDDSFYDFDDNIVGTIKFSHNSFSNQPYVANGYFGARIPNAGQGFARDQHLPGESPDLVNAGWPMFNDRYSGAFIAGFFDFQYNDAGTNFPELAKYGWDSFISAVPQWTTLQLKISVKGQTHVLDPQSLYQIGADQVVSNYVQNMSLSNGVVTTSFTWLDLVDVTYTVFAHRKHQHLGVVSVDLESKTDDKLEIVVEDQLNFNTSERCVSPHAFSENEGIALVFEPHGVAGTNGVIYSVLDHPTEKTKASGNAVSQSVKIEFSSENQKSSVTKFVGIASTDVVQDPWKTAKQVATQKMSFKTLLDSHICEFKVNGDIKDVVKFGGNDLLTLTSRASLFHLFTNTRPNAEGVSAALGVGGLSSDAYAGMVFWDSDLWMMPAILPFFPDHAQQIVNYRYFTHEQARENVVKYADSWHGGLQDPDKHFEGAVYPWTSGRSGNCTATGPCFDYEYHINHAVVQGGWEVYLNGAQDDEYLRKKVWPVMTDAAKFFASLVTFNETLGKYTTSNLTDPDEYANHVDNGAYTNAGIAAVMQWSIDIASHLGETVPAKWSDIKNNMYLPKENNVTLEFSNMNSSVEVKQADVVMLTYPLYEYELLDVREHVNNAAFYAKQQVSYGPAMTYSIFSTVQAKLATAGCSAQSYLLESILPFLRGPFAQFSEQNNDDYSTNGGTHPAFPFLTGHGGVTQALFHGLTGFRPTYNMNSHGQIERVLGLDPISIDCIGGHAKWTKINYMNQSLDFEIANGEFTLVHNGDYPIPIHIGDRNPNSGAYVLQPHCSLSIPLYSPSKKYPDSLSECSLARVMNITRGVAGDGPIVMNDGDLISEWTSKDKNAKILIDLLSIRNVSSMEINFSGRPPKLVSIYGTSGNNKFDSIEGVLGSVSLRDDDWVLKRYKWANDHGKVFSTDDTFDVVLAEQVSVNITAPWKPTNEVKVPSEFNITKFEFEKSAVRFLLVETQDTFDNDDQGPQVAEIIVR